MKEKNSKQKELDADDKPLVQFRPTVNIENGYHEGKIETIELYEGEYQYIRFGILITDIKVDEGLELPTIKIGYPLSLSLKSGLGKLMVRSGYDLTVKSDYSLNDIKKILLNRTIGFNCYTDAEKGDIFTEINRESIVFL